MSSMIELIHDLWFLRRDLLSDGYDIALQRLADQLSGRMEIHEYPTGERLAGPGRCRRNGPATKPTWRRWMVAALIDFADHPLHVVSYSLPFEGVVSRQELLSASSYPSASARCHPVCL